MFGFGGNSDRIDTLERVLICRGCKMYGQRSGPKDPICVGCRNRGYFLKDRVI